MEFLVGSLDMVVSEPTLNSLSGSNDSKTWSRELCCTSFGAERVGSGKSLSGGLAILWQKVPFLPRCVPCSYNFMVIIFPN